MFICLLYNTTIFVEEYLRAFSCDRIRARATHTIHTAGMPKADRAALPAGLLLKAQAKQHELVALL